MNPYRIEWKPSAEKDARRLTKADRGRILAALERLASTLEGDVVKLTAVEPAEYRLRVGDWRVRFSRDDNARVLTVLRVLPRDKVYRVREDVLGYAMGVAQ